MSRRSRERLVALIWACLCHGAFLGAVGLMAFSLATGLVHGAGRLHGTAALAADAVLVLQFPLLHSWLLTRRGAALLRRLAPFDLGSSLAPTSYVFLASLQLLLTFAAWSPSGRVLWQPSGALHPLQLALFGAAWLWLGKALLDAGLGLQSGWIGWRAVWQGRPPRYPDLPESGLFARCRQPIYLGFALVLWTAPAWTPDRLALASAWTVYCVLGPLHKERRFATIYGDRFRAYRARVPYLLPRIAP